MDRKGNKFFNTKSISGFLLLLSLLLLSNSSYAETGNRRDDGYRAPEKHYYYPANDAPFTYESTGKFANQPVVIPHNVKSLKRQDYYEIVAPPPRQVPMAQYPQQPIGRNMAPGYPQYPQLSPAEQAMVPQFQINPPTPKQQAIRPQYKRPAPSQRQAMQHPQTRPTTPPGYNAPVNTPRTYSLHVGSFLIYSQADALEAKVKALGLKPYRKEVAAEGIRYLQLRVGPFRTKKEMRKAASLLNSNKIKNRIAIR
ncbi:MAG: SPOR domain-containing protein [Magnetococcales bacterium]|nr:SPOR domain-containing protein [Magnetococcales bacterium]